MSHYVALTFHPNQANPARPFGRGVYRVHHAGEIGNYASSYLRPRMRLVQWDAGSEVYTRMLYLPAKRLYKDGSRVDPCRVLGL